MPEKQKTYEYNEYGIVPGPIYKEHQEKYLCTFECSGNDFPTKLYDFYVYEGAFGTHYKLVESNEPYDYASGPVYFLLTHESLPWRQAGHILVSRGRFGWKPDPDFIPRRSSYLP